MSFTGEDRRQIVEPGAVIVRVGGSAAGRLLETRVRVTGVTTATTRDREMLTQAVDAPLTP